LVTKLKKIPPKETLTSLVKTYVFSLGGMVKVVVSSPPATEEIGAVSREIESCQGIGWWLFTKKVFSLGGMV
jgi:hypothetical protein